MNDLLVAMGITAPIVVALVAAIRQAEIELTDGRVIRVPSAVLPLVAIAAGVVVALLFPPSMSVANEIASGILAGLSASGLWSGGKAMAGK